MDVLVDLGKNDYENSCKDNDEDSDDEIVQQVWLEQNRIRDRNGNGDGKDDDGAMIGMITATVVAMGTTTALPNRTIRTRTKARISIDRERLDPTSALFPDI